MSSTEVVQYREPPAVTEGQLAIIEKQAAVLARSDAAGPYKGKSADIVLVGLTALALGVPLSAALSEMYVINSRIVPSAALRVGLALRAGHEVWFEESTPQRATACFRRRGSKRIDRLSVGIEDIPAALKGKETWKQYPAPMLRAMASRQLIRAVAPDVVLGLPGVSLEDVDETMNEDTVDFRDHAPELPSAPAEHRPVGQPDTISDEGRADVKAALAALTPEQLEQVKAAVKGRVANVNSHQFSTAHVGLVLEAIADVTLGAQFDDALHEAERVGQVLGEEPSTDA